MNKQKLKLPSFFIEDYSELGWEPVYHKLDGGVTFIRKHEERIITSFAQLRIFLKDSSCLFSPYPVVGTTWDQEAFSKIAGFKSPYPRFEVYPPTRDFKATEYTQSFLKEASDYVLNWAIELDLRQALATTAVIPEKQDYPNNSWSYITAHAILGNLDELEHLAKLVEADKQRPIVGYVKLHHLQKAIECCMDPEKYGLSDTLIAHLREPQQ